MEFAIVGVHGWDPAFLERSLTRARQLGITHIRHDLWMHEVDPCKGEEVNHARNSLTAVINAAKAVGIKVQMSLGAIAAPMGIPTKGGVKCPGRRALGVALTPKAFGKFIAEQVPYYYRLGVRRFSLYNEPNLNFFLCAGDVVNTGSKFMEDQIKCKNSSSKRAAKLYYQLYKSGVGAIRGLQKKKQIGKVEIIFGEIAAAHHGMKFVDLVLKHGKIVADGIAIHPYQFCTAPNTKKKPTKSSPCKRWMPGGMAWTGDWQKKVAGWAKAKRLVNSKGKRVPLLLTEFGYLRAPPPANIPEKVRAAWYPIAMNVAKKAKVKQMLIFGLHGARTATAWDSGILTPDGAPLPSFNKLRFWAKKNGYKQIA